MKKHALLRTIATVGATTLALTLVVGMHAPTAAAAASTNKDWEPFNQATWVDGVGNPGYGLVTASDASGTYGGIELKAKYVPSDPTSITALSFDFYANQTGGSGGSPRMVVQFSDGGDGELRPLAWIANTWTTENGMTSSDWDNQGGTCGFRYETTWAAVMGCHAGATISAIYVVNDSGWLYPATGETVTLDNITVNDITATGPHGNQE